MQMRQMVHTRPTWKAALFGATALLIVGGCSDSSTPNEGTSGTDVPIGSDLGIGQGDVPLAEDTTPGPDDVADDATNDASETEGGDQGAGPDVSADNVPNNPGGPADFGLPCPTDGECLSGWCVLASAGRVCTKSCLNSCPAGWKCGVIQNDGNPVSICIEVAATLCHPCGSNKDCNQVATANPNLCLPHADGGSFCGLSCGDGGGCPDGYQCDAVEGLDGVQSNQCVPVSGQCECNGSAIELGLSTGCRISNQHGECPGVRQCTGDGLSACEGTAAAAEVCNGVDDDCNGEADDGLDIGTCELTNAFGTCPGTQVCSGGDFVCAGNPAVAEVCNGVDDDCDSLTDEGAPDTDNDGVADCVDDDDDDDGWLDGADCAPRNPDAFPGADESCNAIDDDCDGDTDEQDAAGCAPYWQDFDTDGWGAAAVPERCLCGPDYGVFFTANNALDCNDASADAFPGATQETCNGADDDCDGDTDEDADLGPCEITTAGVGTCVGVQACVEGNHICAGQTPKPEECNGVDDNCDGFTDEGALDTDNDGDADCVDGDDDDDGTPDALDCAPLNPDINPEATESCNTFDDDCDGATDEVGAVGCSAFYQDADGDGAGSELVPSRCQCGPDQALFFTSEVPGDCDDVDPTRSPLKTEACNFIDDNCDGSTDEGVASPCGTCSPVCVWESGEGETQGLEPNPDTSSGVVQTPDGGLTLDSSTFELPFVWIANSAENTVSKLNTETGCEVARYSVCLNPSRTAVDLGGNGIITCRNDGRIAKVAVFEQDCVDRDLSSSIETSRDDDGNCQIDATEMVTDDECVLWNVQPDGSDGTNCSVGSQGCARAAGVDEDNNVWVGFWKSMTIKQLDGATGDTLKSHAVGVRPYGLAIDADQNLWVASRAPHSLTLVDPNAGLIETWATPTGQAYGMAIDAFGKIWVARGEHGGALRFDPDTEQWTEFANFGLGYSRGVAVSIERDTEGQVTSSKVYMGHHTWSDCAANGQHRYVSVIDAATLQVEQPIDLGADRGPVGVAIATDGHVWSVNQCDSTATKINAATKTVVGSYPVGLSPYTYSDMTGYALKTITASQGFFRQTFEGWVGSDTLWSQIVVQADLPGDGVTWLTVRYRVADTTLDLAGAEWVGPFGPYPPEVFPIPLDAVANVLEVEVNMHTSDPSVVPKLEKITIIAFEQ